MLVVIMASDKQHLVLLFALLVTAVKVKVTPKQAYVALRDPGG
jgi:hypothetical protein